MQREGREKVRINKCVYSVYTDAFKERKERKAKKSKENKKKERKERNIKEQKRRKEGRKEDRQTDRKKGKGRSVSDCGDALRCESFQNVKVVTFCNLGL